MKIFFWLCLLLLVPGLLLRIDLGGSGILGTDIILPVFAAVWIFQKLVIDQKFPKCHFILPGFVFLGVAILSFLLGAGDLLFKEQVLSGAYLVRFFALLIFGWAAVDLFAEKKEQEQFFRGIFGISAIVVLLGFLQFYLFPDISDFSTEGGWDPHQGRLLGTWMDPNFVSGFLGFMTPVALGKWYDFESSKERFWLGGLILIFLYALFLTFSRSGYLAALCGFFIFFILRDPKVILIGVLLSVIGLAASERAQKRVGELAGTMSAIVFQNTDEIDPTASLRIESWRKSLELYDKYPILGIGYNTYRYRAAEEGIVDESYFSAGGSDSSLLTVLVTTGAVGFLAFLWFLGSLFWQGFGPYLRLIQNPSALRASPLIRGEKGGEIPLGFACGIVAIFVHSFFVNSLLFPLILMPILAVGAVLGKSVDKK